MTGSELEFVNDWSELESAVELLYSLFVREDDTDRGYVDIDLSYENEFWQAVRTIKQYVPRLLTQYANLVELSFALTEGWEQYASLQKPSGLYLPDHG